MTLEINLVEAIWIAMNLSTTVLTLSALVDAMADRKAIILLNGHAREMAAASILRRESFRLVIQALLLAAVVPGIFIGGEAQISPTVLALMAVPVVLFANSALDARDRRRATILVAADILAERTSAMARLESAVAANRSAIAENTAITVDAATAAGDAYRTADSVNEIATHTAEQVDDIHDATVKR